MDNPIWDKPKVCLVDDDANLREIYSIALNREGYDVLLAENGDEGLELIKREKPAVILLDLQMPIMTGFDVLKELRADQELAAIPVIILSNVDNEDAFKEVGKFDTRFYVVKALSTPSKIVAMVKEVLPATT